MLLVLVWLDFVRWDVYVKLDGLCLMWNYDLVYYVVVVEGCIYLFNNLDDMVCCFCVVDGELIWKFLVNVFVWIILIIYGN